MVYFFVNKLDKKNCYAINNRVNHTINLLDPKHQIRQFIASMPFVLFLKLNTRTLEGGSILPVSKNINLIISFS